MLAPALKLNQDQEISPRELRGGASLSFDGLSRLSLAAGSIHKDRAMVGVGFSKAMGDSVLQLGIGAAYTLQDVLTLRLGIDNGFAVGLGLKTADGRFSADYALEDRPLSQNHRFTLTYRFLKPAAPAAVPPVEVPDDEYARARAHAESLGDESFARGRELFRAGRYDEASDAFDMAALLKPEDREVQDMHKRAGEVRRREKIAALRANLDKHASAGDLAGTYRDQAALLRYAPDDRVRLQDEFRQVAQRLSRAARAAADGETVAVSTGEIEAAIARGLDASALSDAAWLASVVTSTPSADAARSLGVRAMSTTRVHRAALEAAIVQARAAGNLGKALAASQALGRAYPQDAAAARTLGAIATEYAVTVHLTAKDRIHMRKLYDLAAVAWYRRDASRAQDLLEELRRYDAADSAAAALMDAMARAGMLRETFQNNGGGL